MAMIIGITTLPGITLTAKVLRIEFNRSALITEHPTELGTVITDNAQPRPIAFTVDAVIDSSPVNSFASPFARDQAIGFLELAAGKLLTVAIDGVGLFTQVLMESWPYTIVGRRSMHLTVRFKQLSLVTPLTVLIPARIPLPNADGVASDLPLPPTSTVDKSAAASGFDIVGVGVSGFKALFGFE